jgi:outer membrane receptor protein involved in Fe transport
LQGVTKVSKYAVSASFARALALSVLGAGFLLQMSQQVVAAEPAEEEDTELEEVQVTGTRIQSPNVTSANPITSIGGEEMRKLGMVNVADALTQLVPQNLSTYTPALVGDNQASGGGGMDQLDRGSFFIGNTIANLRGMDPTFGTRTLTLVDGRRVVSTSNQADVVDINIIPSNLLERMDVVTGGASATYGSGAMAGVVNLVLNSRLTGFNLDMDYGVNEAGDGASPHISASGGMPLLNGRAHVLLGAEWQDTHAIRDCAAARDWCAESRALFGNSQSTGAVPSTVNTPLPGFENYPARFEMTNVRYSQFAPTGTIFSNTATTTSGFRFTPDGTHIEEYPYGFRGGTGQQTINGDGPLVTSGTAMQPSSERKTLFSNFEFNFTERTTGYVQGNYAKTEGENKNRYTAGTYCARFDTQGVRGANTPAGGVWSFGNTFGTLIDGTPYSPPRSPQLNLTITPGVVAFLGLPTNSTAYLTGAGTPANGGFPYPQTGVTAAGLPYGPGAGGTVPGVVWPFWVPVELSPSGPPAFNFNGNAVGKWVRFKFNSYTQRANIGVGGSPPTASDFGTPFRNDFWLLDSVTLTNAYEGGTSTVLPATGRNAYAFLNQLDPQALAQIQNAFGNSTTAGGGAGVSTLYGANPCTGYTALRKVWNPQVQQYTRQESETMRFVGGVRGRFGSDWRWDSYYQYGQTESSSSQNDVATNLRLAFAMDAVIDDRATIDGVANPTYQQPVCRITRDGVPILDTNGRPLSNAEGLADLAAACRPINIFGTGIAPAGVYPGNFDAALTQQQAIDYAFVEASSSGKNSLQTLSFQTNGTLWQGWGAGPLASAFGIELRQDTVDNAGSQGDFYLRSDLARTWSDAFGGKTRVVEGNAEFDMPLIGGLDGINLWSLNIGARYSNYHNKGGTGTTGESATQNVFNWKFQTVFEPFDWVRFRLTRSRDLRAATYRELFIFQPGIPDELTINNPWRERTATSTENQTERYGRVQVGNPDLKPETSDSLTLGLVLSPGGWAQGLRLSADYYDISLKRGINTPFNSTNPVRACFEQSGNSDAQDQFDESGNFIGVNTQFDETLEACRQIRFAEQLDASGNPIPGTRNLQDLVSFDAFRPQNSLPYKRRGVDLSMNYVFQLSRAIESLPGSVSLTFRGQRAMESSGVQQTVNSLGYYLAGSGNTVRSPNPDACGAKYDAADPNNANFYANRYTCIDMVGQIRSNVFVPGVAATPKWTGSFVGSYSLGDLTTSISARYTGGAALDRTFGDSIGDANYKNAAGQYLVGSVDNNWVKPYFNWSLNASYNLQVAGLKQFQVFGSISNLFDKSPPFTGGGLSGASAQYHDVYGRAYRTGVRLKF